MIFSIEFVGKKPPFEIKLILKFRELNIRTCENLVNIINVRIEYIIKILIKNFDIIF